MTVFRINKNRDYTISIFWDINSLTSEVKLEIVTEQGLIFLEMPKKVQKQVLHITITSKTAEQMKNEYNFFPSQMLQYNELSSNKYSYYGIVLFIV